MHRHIWRALAWPFLIVGVADRSSAQQALTWEQVHERFLTNNPSVLAARILIQESRAKEEAVFILKSINEYLILFFRGQILVAFADGILLTIGFFAMGLNYALLLGMAAGL